MTYEQFLEMLAYAAAAGWASEVHCATHDGVRTTGEEAEQVDNNLAPCQPIIRLWGVDAPANDRIRFDSNLNPADLLTDAELTVADILQSTDERQSTLHHITGLLERLIEPDLEEVLETGLSVGRWVAAVEYLDEAGESKAVRLVGPDEVGLVDAAGLLDQARGLL